MGHLHHVPFVFSSNGHLFVEYDEETGQTSEARPLAEFPTPQELIARYLAARALPEDAALLKPLQREDFDFRSDSASSSAEPSPVATGKDKKYSVR